MWKEVLNFCFLLGVVIFLFRLGGGLLGGGFKFGLFCLLFGFGDYFWGFSRFRFFIRKIIV